MAKDTDQTNMFEGLGVKKTWEEEWDSMPEYVLNDLTSFQSIIVHFENKEELKKFAELVEQKLTYKTKSIWYPKVKIETYMDKRYVNKDISSEEE